MKCIIVDFQFPSRHNTFILTEKVEQTRSDKV